MKNKLTLMMIALTALILTATVATALEQSTIIGYVRALDSEEAESYPNAGGFIETEDEYVLFLKTGKGAALAGLEGSEVEATGAIDREADMPTMTIASYKVIDQEDE